jgi:hypothetical protein
MAKFYLFPADDLKARLFQLLMSREYMIQNPDHAGPMRCVESQIHWIEEIMKLESIERTE